MKPLRSALDFLLSLRTTIWLIPALLLLLLFGAVIMPSKEEFQALYTVPLFQWLRTNSISITWWLWAAIGVLSLLAANTLLCSLESVVKKRGARHWLLVLSPQVIHAGFLFILLAHLLSSYGSFKGMAYVSGGTMLQLPDGPEVLFSEISASIDPSGYITDWSASVKYFRAGREIGSGEVLPNQPSFREGFGIYIKTVRPGPVPTALIEVSREPGALFALIGGIMFLVGMTTLLILKARREEVEERDEG